RNVDLARLGARGVHDGQPGTVAQQHALLGEGEGARDQGLGGHDGGEGGHGEEGIEERARSKQIEGIAHGRRRAEEKRALAEVVEEERRQDHAEPGEANGAAAEVSHVGIEGLGAGDGEYHRARTRKAARECCTKSRAPGHGFRARRISGEPAISTAPRRPMMTNQPSMIGPNTPPTRAVPKRWPMKRRRSTAKVPGTTRWRSSGTAISMPSRARSTEMAGVIPPSP